MNPIIRAMTQRLMANTTLKKAAPFAAAGATQATPGMFGGTIAEKLGLGSGADYVPKPPHDPKMDWETVFRSAGQGSPARAMSPQERINQAFGVPGMQMAPPSPKTAPPERVYGPNELTPIDAMAPAPAAPPVAAAAPQPAPLDELGAGRKALGARTAPPALTPPLMDWFRRNAALLRDPNTGEYISPPDDVARALASF